MIQPADDFSEYLTSQAQSEIASLHQFMVLYDASDSALHLFFEGDDDPCFYLPEVRIRALARPIRVYVCGGKRSVLSVRKDIASGGYDLKSCLFFIDRDYDTYLACQDEPDEQTYITDYYSIENCLVSNEAVDIILVDVIGMSHADPDFEKIKSSVARTRARSAKLLLPWMAWCLASKSKNEKPNFNNANLGKIVKVTASGDLTLEKRAFQMFRKSIKVDTQVSRSELVSWCRHIQGDDVKLWMRGKFELWFFESSLLICLNELVAERKVAKLRSPRIPSALRERSLFDLLGGRISAHLSLKEFLDAKLAA